MVSGASRGIGRAVVDRLQSTGFKVSGAMRDPAALPETDRILSCAYEAEAAGSAQAWVDATVARFGRVDAVVNAAGINPKVRAFDDDEDGLDAMWRINVKGPLRVVRAAYPHLAESGHGRVVNLGSLSGKRVASNVGYAMSKFAVVALTTASGGGRMPIRDRCLSGIRDRHTRRERDRPARKDPAGGPCGPGRNAAHAPEQCLGFRGARALPV